MQLFDIIISLVGGFGAGFINSLAGFGSVITLAIYMDVMNIPGHIANATNRVNVLASSSVSAITYHKNNLLDLKIGKKIIAIVTVGALIGIYLASIINAEQFENFYKYILIPILIMLLINPKKFITPDMSKPAISNYLSYPLYFLFGIYAGFIQVGFGVLFLIVVISLDKFNLIKANALKVAIVAFYTIAAVTMFHIQGLIRWEAGLLIALGQAIGGYSAVKVAAKMEGANKFAYYLIVVIVVLVIIKNFELWSLLTD